MHIQVRKAPATKALLEILVLYELSIGRSRVAPPYPKRGAHGIGAIGQDLHTRIVILSGLLLECAQERRELTCVVGVLRSSVVAWVEGHGLYPATSG